MSFVVEKQSITNYVFIFNSYSLKCELNFLWNPSPIDWEYMLPKLLSFPFCLQGADTADYYQATYLIKGTLNTVWFQDNEWNESRDPNTIIVKLLFRNDEWYNKIYLFNYYSLKLCFL